MAQLEDITVGAKVVGITGNAPATVIAVKWHGSSVLEVTYKDAGGRPDSRLIYKE